MGKPSLAKLCGVRLNWRLGKPSPPKLREVRLNWVDCAWFAMKKSDTFAPTDAMVSAAKRGLALRSEFGRGGTDVGIARARTIVNGQSLPLSTVRRVYSFFSRHAVDRRPDWADPSNPSNGYIAHLLWGGDAGYSWSRGIRKRAISAKVW